MVGLLASVETLVLGVCVHISADKRLYCRSSCIQIPPSPSRCLFTCWVGAVVLFLSLREAQLHGNWVFAVWKQHSAFSLVDRRGSVSHLLLSPSCRASHRKKNCFGCGPTFCCWEIVPSSSTPAQASKRGRRRRRGGRPRRCWFPLLCVAFFLLPRSFSACFPAVPKSGSSCRRWWALPVASLWCVVRAWLAAALSFVVFFSLLRFYFGGAKQRCIPGSKVPSG